MSKHPGLHSVLRLADDRCNGGASLEMNYAARRACIAGLLKVSKVSSSCGPAKVDYSGLFGADHWGRKVDHLGFFGDWGR